jgi:hypothetical protein
MAGQRNGKNAVNVAALGTTGKDQARGRAGRTVGLEKYTKATVPLFDRQIAALDEVRAAIKRKTGASVMRAEIIRATLDAVLEAEIDLTSVRPEPEFKNGDLKRLIAVRLKA